MGGAEMRPTVLVVDDSKLIRQQVTRALSAAGFAVVEAVDGADALSKLAHTSGVCLAVCDVNMPVMNGIELLERLNAEGHAIPVLMLTTEGQPETIQRAKALGAKGWMVKPFKVELLVATAKKLASVAA